MAPSALDRIVPCIMRAQGGLGVSATNGFGVNGIAHDVRPNAQGLTSKIFVRTGGERPICNDRPVCAV